VCARAAAKRQVRHPCDCEEQHHQDPDQHQPGEREVPEVVGPELQLETVLGARWRAIVERLL